MGTSRDTPQGEILIVDDNPRVLEATSELLRIHKLRAITARNGLEALDLLKTHGGISVVLLDLWMPVMDGWEFLRRQKRDPQISSIPVVVVSAVASASVEGADTVLKKPVELRRLIETVERYAQRIDHRAVPS